MNLYPVYCFKWNIGYCVLLYLYITVGSLTRLGLWKLQRSYLQPRLSAGIWFRVARFFNKSTRWDDPWKSSSSARARPSSFCCGFGFFLPLCIPRSHTWHWVRWDITCRTCYGEGVINPNCSTYSSPMEGKKEVPKLFNGSIPMKPTRSCRVVLLKPLSSVPSSQASSLCSISHYILFFHPCLLPLSVKLILSRSSPAPTFHHAHCKRLMTGDPSFFEGTYVTHQPCTHTFYWSEGLIHFPQQHHWKRPVIN